MFNAVEEECPAEGSVGLEVLLDDPGLFIAVESDGAATKATEATKASPCGFSGRERPDESATKASHGLMLEAALAYAKAGWAVVPLREDGSKRPKFKTGPDHAGAATCDVLQVTDWWTRWPEAPIGVVPATSGHVVIDVDGEQGRETFDAHPGPFPPTACSISGREAGGFHLWYRVPPTAKAPRGRILGPGLELKAAGNLVVAPPSLHKSGRRYRWEVPPSRVPCQVPPDWMLEDPNAPNLRPVRPAQRRLPDGADATKEGAIRLRGITETVATAPVGNRHACLYWAARQARELYDAGHVAEQVAIDHLRRAIEWNADTCGVPLGRDVEPAIADGWAKGAS